VQQELSHAAGASGIAGQLLARQLPPGMRAGTADGTTAAAAAAAARAAAAAAATPGALATRATAAAAAAAGTPSGGPSLSEAVEGSPLAQLLRRAGQGAAGPQQQLSLSACMPQLADLPEVQAIRWAFQQMPGSS
jgi:hypothetical protein